MGIPLEDMLDIEEAIAQHRANLEKECQECGTEGEHG